MYIYVCIYVCIYVTYETLQANPVYAQSLAHIHNVCWINHKVPYQWKHGVVTFIPKKAPDSDDWRPISLLLVNCKIFMAIVSKRLLSWIVDNQRLSPKQKASLPCNGLQEHVFCLKHALDNFRNSSGKLFACFINLSDAFSSIYHDIMIREVHSAHYPYVVCDISQDIYSECTFQVKYGKYLTLQLGEKKVFFKVTHSPLSCSSRA